MNTNIPLDRLQQSGAVDDMYPTTFRHYSQQMVERIASYLDHVGTYPVLAKTSPGELRHELPDHPPLHPEPMEVILSDVDRLLLPGITHWNAPGFLAYFSPCTSGPSILAEMLKARGTLTNPYLMSILAFGIYVLESEVKRKAVLTVFSYLPLGSRRKNMLLRAIEKLRLRQKGAKVFTEYDQYLLLFLPCSELMCSMHLSCS